MVKGKKGNPHLSALVSGFPSSSVLLGHFVASSTSLCQRGKKRWCPYFLTANAGWLPPPSYTDLWPATSANHGSHILTVRVDLRVAATPESSQERPLCWSARSSVTWWVAKADLPMQSNTLASVITTIIVTVTRPRKPWLWNFSGNRLFENQEFHEVLIYNLIINCQSLTPAWMKSSVSGKMWSRFQAMLIFAWRYTQYAKDHHPHSSDSILARLKLLGDRKRDPMPLLHNAVAPRVHVPHGMYDRNSIMVILFTPHLIAGWLPRCHGAT